MGEITEKQEQTLTNLIVENREVVLSRQKELDTLIAKYLKVPQEAEETGKVPCADRPASDDRITNLINELKDTNQLIRSGLGGRIEEICKRLSRL